MTKFTKWATTILAAGVLQSAAQDAGARPFKITPNTGGLTVSPLSRRGTADPAIIAGKVADASDFPASFYADLIDNAGMAARCTATLVGPQAVLTAAHCVGNRQTITIKQQGANVDGLCVHHPNYSTDPSADYALCKLTRQIPGLTPESISIGTSEITRDRRVLLAGYGCINPDTTEGNDGVFRFGFAITKQLTGKVKLDGKLYPNYYGVAPDSNSLSPAILCPGDSGGAAYCLTDDKKIRGKRVICAVNSSVQCLGWRGRQCTEIGTISYLAAMSTQESWLKVGVRIDQFQDIKICGIDAEIANDCLR